MHETFTLPEGLVHSALDPACFPFCSSCPHLSSGRWSDAWLSGLPLPTHHLPSLNFLFHRGVSIGKETQRPFQESNPQGTESRRNGSKSVQPSFITRLGRCATRPRSVRCLSVPLFVCLYFSLSFSLSLPPLSLSSLSLLT